MTSIQTFIVEPGTPELAICAQWRANAFPVLHASFQENLGDEDFGIEQLCDIMAMSRAQLYRKFKALTNRTIIDYLNSFRLHRARQLLEESDLNVTQVAYQVGFKNLSHFSHRFTEEYGINPNTVRKSRS